MYMLLCDGTDSAHSRHSQQHKHREHVIIRFLVLNRTSPFSTGNIIFSVGKKNCTKWYEKCYMKCKIQVKTATKAGEWSTSTTCHFIIFNFSIWSCSCSTFDRFSSKLQTEWTQQFFFFFSILKFVILDDFSPCFIVLPS